MRPGRNLRIQTPQNALSVTLHRSPKQCTSWLHSIYQADCTGLNAVPVTGGTACCRAPRISGSVTKPTQHTQRKCPAPARPATIHNSPTGVRAFLWSKRSMGRRTKGAIHGGIKGVSKAFQQLGLYLIQKATCFLYLFHDLFSCRRLYHFLFNI